MMFRRLSLVPVGLAALLSVLLAVAVARADFDAGTAAYDAGDYATAIAEWQPLAEAGDTAAQLAMGILHENGRGVPRDNVQAAAWYQRAADGGHPIAQFNLGNLYQQGLGVERDPAQAVYWWTLAADQDLPNAQLNLGIAYHMGQGIEENQEQALALFLAASQAGNPAAHFSAGYAYEVGLGTAPDVDEARRLYALAAEAGVEQAAGRLAGLGPADQDVAEAEAEQPEDPGVSTQTASVRGDWPFVQLAAFLTIERAQTAWRTLGERYPDLLGDVPHRVHRIASSNETGELFVVQAGPMPFRDEAEALCAALRARDGECFLTGP